MERMIATQSQQHGAEPVSGATIRVAAVAICAIFWAGCAYLLI